MKDNNNKKIGKITQSSKPTKVTGQNKTSPKKRTKSTGKRYKSVDQLVKMLSPKVQKLYHQGKERVPEKVKQSLKDGLLSGLSLAEQGLELLTEKTKKVRRNLQEKLK